MAAVKCCGNGPYVLYLLERVCVFAQHTSSTNDAPYCRWRGLFDNNKKKKNKEKKWKIKTEHAKTKPGSSATQHNYYFANVGALKKCLQEIQSGALAPAR